MKRESFRIDVIDLVERSMLAESREKIWCLFDKSLSTFDRTTLIALRLFFEGSSNRDISKRLNISEAQSRDLVQKAKRNLVENLRRYCKVKQ